MKLEEYKNRLKLIEIEANNKKKSLAKKYCLANNTVIIGDTIEDHIGKIIVDKINFQIGLNGVPYCVYFGIEITKKGEPFKNNRKRYVHQTNLTATA